MQPATNEQTNTCQNRNCPEINMPPRDDNPKIINNEILRLNKKILAIRDKRAEKNGTRSGL